MNYEDTISSNRAFHTRLNVTTRALYILLLFFNFSNTVQANKCADDKLYKYNGKINQTCQWVAQNIENRCQQVDVNYVDVKDRCRLTCNNCWSTVAMGRTTGQFCTEGSQCFSGVCRQQTCYASEHCRPLKQPWGGTFERNKIVLVFVGSGFTNRKQWQAQVSNTFKTFSTFEMFEYTNLSFNVFYVDMLEESFCDYGCRGVDSLLCCESEKAKVLASKCFPSQATLQTIVIHNDEKYGGAGYRDDNIATTSTHPESGYVAVHELGHSLFELGDEYDNAVFNAGNSANCDVSGCPKWSDLSNHLGVELCEPQACQGADYFVGSPSFMDDLMAPVGEVNLRFTCCTYLALTKGVPSYCDRFEFGEGLVNYCKRDYQGYGGTASYQMLRATQLTGREYKSQFRLNYLYVARPAVILVDVNEQTFAYVEQQNRYGTKPVIHRRRQMLGDYYDIPSAFVAGAKEVWKITVIFDSGQKQEMLFRSFIQIDSPIEDQLVILALGDTSTPSVMEIVVDGSKGLVLDVESKVIRITWHAVLKAWLCRVLHSVVAFFS